MSRQLIVPCLDGKVYCLDENTARSCGNTGGEVKCGLALTDCGSKPGYRLLWGQSHGGSAFAIAASGPHAGKAIWRYENSGPGVAEPVVDDIWCTKMNGAVFFANLKGDVFVVNAAAVTRDWRSKGPDGIKEAKEYVVWSTNVGAPVFSTPSVHFELTQGTELPIHVANVDGLVFGLNRETGQGLDS